MRARGRAGRLYVGSRLAATLADYELTWSPEGLGTTATQLTARVGTADAYWLTQPATRVTLDVGWTWTTWRTLTVVGDTLTAWLTEAPSQEPYE